MNGRLDITDRIRPRREITGMSAILVPFADEREIDWGALEAHIGRTAGCGLMPAVNMDTGYVQLLSGADRIRVLDLAAAGTGLAAWTVSPGIVRVLGGMIRFDTSLAVPPLTAAALALCGLLAAYIPLTHMSHFIAKYFTYHDIRWDDRVNLRGGKIEATIAEYLTYRPTWSAKHVGADGTKTWAEVATTNPAQKGKA